MDYYVIPAREGSKGLPHKNRMLFKYVLPQLNLKDRVVLTTDDEELIKVAKSIGIVTIKRPKELAADDTSTKDVLLHVVDELGLNSDDRVIMLYLTYPDRTKNDIYEVKKFFKKNNASSLLCRKEVKGTHPFLMLLAQEGNTGKQLVEHNLYRRQTYPEVFEISHFIFISYVRELINLNNNLYNESTIYYPIGDVIDVDTESDLHNFLNTRG